MADIELNAVEELRKVAEELLSSIIDRFADQEAKIANLEAENQRLAKFKAYVHKRLDKAGVSVDPDSPHKAKGCRIGGRLDIVLGKPRVTDGLQIARMFHETYEWMAPQFGYITRPETRVFDENSPKALLMAAVSQKIGDWLRQEPEDRAKAAEAKAQQLEERYKMLEDGIQVYRRVIKSLPPLDPPLAFGSQHLIDIWEETIGQKLMSEQNYSHAPRNIYVDTENLKQEF